MRSFSASMVVFCLFIASAVAQEKRAREPVSHYEHLKGVEFWVGEWIGKSIVPAGADRLAGEEITVPVTVKWAFNKNVLIGNWRVEHKGEIINQGQWLWWWDTKAKQIRTLSVMTMGDYGEGAWTKQGEKWVAKWTGATADGEDTSSVLTTTVHSDDHITHEWTEQIRGDKSEPDSRADFKRVKSKEK